MPALPCPPCHRSTGSRAALACTRRCMRARRAVQTPLAVYARCSGWTPRRAASQRTQPPAGRHGTAAPARTAAFVPCRPVGRAPALRWSCTPRFVTWSALRRLRKRRSLTSWVAASLPAAEQLPATRREGLIAGANAWSATRLSGPSRNRRRQQNLLRAVRRNRQRDRLARVISHGSDLHTEPAPALPTAACACWC